MRHPKRLFQAVLLAAALIAMPATLQTGCGHATLEQGGAYAPLPVTNIDGTVTQQGSAYELFVIDQSFQLAHTAVATVFQFERDNRALLWQVSPEIKHSLDRIRPQVVDAETRFAVGRKAYIAAPVPQNLTTLQGILTELQRLSLTAQAVVPANNPSKASRAALAPAPNP